MPTKPLSEIRLARSKLTHGERERIDGEVLADISSSGFSKIDPVNRVPASIKRYKLKKEISS
jgi:hypothetical protein